MELPDSFIHSPPEGYSYETIPFKTSTVAIWINGSCSTLFNLNSKSHCIWGFYNTQQRQYYSPITSTKQGDKIDINHTTPYSAMKRNLTPLEMAFNG